MVKFIAKCDFHSYLCYKTIILNFMGVLIYNGVLKRVPRFIIGSKAPTSLLEASKMVYLFSIKIVAILDILLVVMLCLTTTLCERKGTPNAMVRLEDISIPTTIPQQVFKANHIIM